jgi:hypothetical protein
MAELGDSCGERKYLDGASKTADYALSVQRPNGWFAENDLDFHDRPLTHTIGYVLEGLHGIGVRLARKDCLDAVERALRAIAPRIGSNGFLAGRLREDWSAAVNWACLTGSAQIAGVYLRMYLRTGNAEYFRCGQKLLGFVCFTQDLQPGIPGVDGGIRGSFPFDGDYCQWSLPNWASKFFSDSVMNYLEAQDKARLESVTVV